MSNDIEMRKMENKELIEAREKLDKIRDIIRRRDECEIECDSFLCESDIEDIREVLDPSPPEETEGS
jgi:hypothetical protein